MPWPITRRRVSFVKLHHKTLTDAPEHTQGEYSSPGSNFTSGSTLLLSQCDVTCITTRFRGLGLSLVSRSGPEHCLSSPLTEGLLTVSVFLKRGGLHTEGSGLFLFMSLELENIYWDFAPGFKTKQPLLRETKHGKCEVRYSKEES